MRRVASILIAVVVGGCAPVAPPPDAAMAARAASRWPDSDTASLAHGRNLYVARCAGCHVLYRPDGYDDDAWRKWVRKMQVKAKLDEGQAELVLRYVLSAR